MTNDQLQAMAAHFDARAARYAAKYTVAKPRHLYQHEKRERLTYTSRWIAQYAQLHPEGHLLDVGCGDGRMVCEVLDSHGAWRATGIDVSASMIRVARQLSNTGGLDRRASWQVGTLQETSGTFDIVVSLGVVGYQSDQSTFIRALAERVRPGGLLIFTFANALSIPRRARAMVRSLRQMGHEKGRVVQFRPMAPRVVDRCLASAGLQRVSSRWLCFGLGLSQSPREVALSRWFESHCQLPGLAQRLAQVSLACYQSPSRPSSSS